VQSEHSNPQELVLRRRPTLILVKLQALALPGRFVTLNRKSSQQLELIVAQIVPQHHLRLEAERNIVGDHYEADSRALKEVPHILGAVQQFLAVLVGAYICYIQRLAQDQKLSPRIERPHVEDEVSRH